MNNFPRVLSHCAAASILILGAGLFPPSKASAVTVTNLAQSVTNNSITLEFGLSGLTSPLAGANLTISPQSVPLDVFGYLTPISLVDSPPPGMLLGSFDIGDTILNILDFINDLFPPPMPPPTPPIDIEIIGLSLRSVSASNLGNSVPAVEINLNSGTTDSIVVRVPPEIPVPTALPLLASGLGLMGLLGWRRKKRAAAC